MLNELKAASELTRTENGAIAYTTTGSHCLDFFSLCGALRGIPESEIIRMFIRAYTENADAAMRILFYSRDIRGGLGERRVFETVIRHLALHNPESVLRNLEYFAEYGRYDDMLVLLGTECEQALADYIRSKLNDDLNSLEAGENVSLLAKWLPSVNTSNNTAREHAKKLCKLLGMSQKQYRRMLSLLRARIGIVEDALRRKDYSFEYCTLPAKALFKYRKAMRKHDQKRYNKFISSVAGGKADMNTSTLYPYEIVQAAMSCKPSEINTLDATWNALESITDARNAIAVIDGSGSMYSTYGKKIMPSTIALSLGIYFAEHNTGHFANHFITFSSTPRLVEIKGKNIVEKVEYCETFNEVSNTDLYKVFFLLLSTAVRNSLPQSELPELIYIISDMEFDKGVDADATVFEDAKRLYDHYGYKMPQVVFWNVCAHGIRFPVRMNENGVALVSGASPSIFSMMMSHEISPVAMMETVISSERYRVISA